jgi:hypothetical protein
MELELYQQLEPGDLVFMREYDEILGWVTKKDTMFLILGVKRGDSSEPLDALGRDMVRFSGGGIEGETFSGYFVRCEEEKNETH